MRKTKQQIIDRLEREVADLSSRIVQGGVENRRLIDTVCKQGERIAHEVQRRVEVETKLRQYETPYEVPFEVPPMSRWERIKTWFAQSIS